MPGSTWIRLTPIVLDLGPVRECQVPAMWPLLASPGSRVVPVCDCRVRDYRVRDSRVRHAAILDRPRAHVSHPADAAGLGAPAGCAGRALPYPRTIDGSLIVSILALLVASGSVALALRADRRATTQRSHGRRANLVVESRGSSAGSTGLLFDLRVRNVGSAVARDVAVWLEDESGRVVSAPAGGTIVALSPAQAPVRLELAVSDAALPPPPVSFGVRISWSDLAGRHERVPSGTTVST